MTQSPAPVSKRTVIVSTLTIVVAAVAVVLFAMIRVKEHASSTNQVLGNSTNGSNTNTSATGTVYENTTYKYRIRYPTGRRIQVDSPEAVYVQSVADNPSPVPSIRVSRQSVDAYVSSLLAEDPLNRKTSDSEVMINGLAVRRVTIHTAVGLDFEHDIVKGAGVVLDVAGKRGDAVFESIRDTLELY